MEYNGEGIEALAALIEEMKRTSIILLDKKVKELLKLLAYYSEFREVLTEVNKNYVHEDGKRRALVTFVGRDVIKVPTDNKELVAFVSNLLVEFDSGAEDIMDFASRYFPSESTQASIALFMKELMDPFKKAIAYLVVNPLKVGNVIVIFPFVQVVGLTAATTSPSNEVTSLGELVITVPVVTFPTASFACTFIV